MSIVQAGGKGAPPYLKMSNNLSEFVPLECFPPAFSMKDPSQLPTEAVISFCDHIWHRQETMSEDDVFRFRCVRLGRLSTAVVDATYSSPGDQEEDTGVSVAAGKKRKHTTKTKALNKSQLAHSAAPIGLEELAIPERESPIPQPACIQTELQAPPSSTIQVDSPIPGFPSPHLESSLSTSIELSTLQIHSHSRNRGGSPVQSKSPNSTGYTDLLSNTHEENSMDLNINSDNGHSYSKDPLYLVPAGSHVVPTQAQALQMFDDLDHLVDPLSSFPDSNGSMNIMSTAGQDHNPFSATEFNGMQQFFRNDQQFAPQNFNSMSWLPIAGNSFQQNTQNSSVAGFNSFDLQPHTPNPVIVPSALSHVGNIPTPPEHANPFPQPVTISNSPPPQMPLHRMADVSPLPP